MWPEGAKGQETHTHTKGGVASGSRYVRVNAACRLPKIDYHARHEKWEQVQGALERG